MPSLSLCAEATRAKNNLLNHGGYSPVQWVLGHTPDDLTSLLSHVGDEHLGVHQSLVDEEEKAVPRAVHDAVVDPSGGQRIFHAGRLIPEDSEGDAEESSSGSSTLPNR